MRPVQDNEAIVARPRYEVDRKLIVPVSYFKRSARLAGFPDVANINTMLLADRRRSSRPLSM